MISAVGELIKQAREKKRLSQTAAARTLKFSEQFLGSIEAGKAPLPLTRVKKVKKFFKISNQMLLKAYVQDYARKIGRVLDSKTKRR